ncbi:MAG TPA: glycosyl transferase family 1, partial [Desulfobacterales bacterium]|nr:glycosyl transferase family 1 [Desulfobacterales bacterium]
MLLLVSSVKYWNKDVIFYINTMLPFGATLAGWLMGKPVIYHIHEISLKPAIFKRFLRFFIQKSATQLIFVSEAVEQAESFTGLKQVVVHNALVSSFYTMAEQHH